MREREREAGASLIIEILLIILATIIMCEGIHGKTWDMRCGTRSCIIYV